MKINGNSSNNINNNGLSLIAPKFAYKYDYDTKKYKFYKLKKGLKVCNVNVNNIDNFEYIEYFNSFEEIDKKYLIEIFESEYNDWFIDRLNSLYKRKKGKLGGFNINEQIVLKICISFPETFYKLKNSKYIWNKKESGQDGKNFREGCILTGIGNNDRNLIDDFYGNVRCELYHFGSIKGNRYIDYEYNKKAFDIIYKKGESYCINLGEFIKRIKKCMNDYVSELKENDELYQIFLENYVKNLDSYLK